MGRKLETGTDQEKYLSQLYQWLRKCKWKLPTESQTHFTTTKQIKKPDNIKHWRKTEAKQLSTLLKGPHIAAHLEDKLSLLGASRFCVPTLHRACQPVCQAHDPPRIWERGWGQEDKKVELWSTAFFHWEWMIKHRAESQSGICHKQKKQTRV